MINKVFRVMTSDGKLPFKHEYAYCRNIHLTRGEAELLRVAIKAYNTDELVIEESEVQWKPSGS